MAESKQCDTTTPTSPTDYAIERLEREKKLLHGKIADNPYIKFAWFDDSCSEQDPSRLRNSVYVKISNVFGLEDEFTNGEYIAEITVGQNYPWSPPRVKFLTPNGVTLTNQTLSINPFNDIFHSRGDGWFPALGIYGAAQLLPAVLMQWRELGYGIAIKSNKSKEDIKCLALGAAAYNSKELAEINALFAK